MKIRGQGAEGSGVHRRRGVSTTAVIASLVALMALGVALWLMVGGGARSSRGEVVLYVSADDFVAREVVAAFEDASGYDVKMVTDTEAQKTTGLVERLRSERNAPVADVFWSSEVFLTIALAEEGVLAPAEPVAAAARPESSRDVDGRWFGFAPRARVIAYSEDRIALEDVPKAWSDLAKDRWTGRVVMADPRFGTTGGHLGAMKVWWDRNLVGGFYGAWLLGLRDAEVRMLPGGNAAAVQAIVDGSADLAMTDTDDVWAARRNGHSVGFVYPDHSKDGGRGIGTLLIPNTVAMIAGGPNPEAGLELVEFLLSPEAERILSESDSRNVPTHPDLEGRWPDLEVPNPLRVDFARAAAAREQAVIEAMRILAGPAGGEDWPDAVPPPPLPPSDDDPGDAPEGGNG